MEITTEDAGQLPAKKDNQKFSTKPLLHIYLLGDLHAITNDESLCSRHPLEMD